MNVYHVTWTYRPDPNRGATIPPRFASCLDEATAKEVIQGLEMLRRTDLTATIFAALEPERPGESDAA